MAQRERHVRLPTELAAVSRGSRREERRWGASLSAVAILAMAVALHFADLELDLAGATGVEVF